MRVLARVCVFFHRREQVVCALIDTTARTATRRDTCKTFPSQIVDFLGFEQVLWTVLLPAWLGSARPGTPYHHKLVELSTAVHHIMRRCATRADTDNVRIIANRSENRFTDPTEGTNF